MSFKPIVCVVCDRFITPGTEKFLTLEVLSNNQALFYPEDVFDLSPELILCYQISMPGVGIHANIPENFEIEQCLLSPRSTYISSEHEDHGFLTCEDCYKCVLKNKRPKYCIANNFCFGSPPECLLQLTDIERAILSPVKTHGYHFCYTGGQKHKLIGSLLYYKIDTLSILRSIAYLDASNANIVVIIYGNLTKEQYKTVSEKNKVRIPMLKEAIYWLLDNNDEWKKLNIQRNDYDIIIQRLNEMTVPEYNHNFEIVDDDDLETENEEVLDIFFPDKSLNIKNGGQDSIEELQRLVQEATMNNDVLFCKLSTMKESVQDYKDKNLVNACLLQFPFGRGAMDELRYNKKDDKITTVVDVAEYLLYISNISLKYFHEGLFQLIIFYMTTKISMVSGAYWQVRQKIDPEMLATRITRDDVEQAINNTKIARAVYTEESDRGRQLLRSIDAICFSSPHSNECTKLAKLQAQTIQHYFGSPSIFLTVTPDDDNHFMIQVLSGEFIDHENIPVNQLDDIELSLRAKKRTEVRLKYPGLCALFFEYALNTVILEVIGWNVKTNKQENSGLFGRVDAFSCTIEEQGRSTLHAHLLIWLPIMNKLRTDLHDPNSQQRAETIICHLIDKVSSSKCFFNDEDFLTQQNNGRRRRKRFIHDCTEPNNYHLPIFPNDETLLQLRSYKGNDDELIVCNVEGCDHKWSFNTASTSYLKGYVQLPLFSSYASEPRVKRLKALAIEYHKNQHQSSIPNYIIDFGYNFHFHTPSCVKATKNDKTKYVGRKLRNKCRYNYPQKNRERTLIQNVTTAPVQWYHWNGTHELRHIQEVLNRRERSDAFQNTCCTPISHSKLTCNTNIRFVLPGPNAEYCFNYSMKQTNKQDSEPYEKLKNSIGKTLSDIKYEENNNLEAVRRLLSLAHKNQSENAIRPTLAAYLTRNKSRFIFSHKFTWCPLRDLKLLVNNGEVRAKIGFYYKNPYYKCTAINYLCRPNSLNMMCPLDFFSLYDVTTFSKVKARQGAELLINTEYFQHPSYDAKYNCCKLCVLKRDQPYLVQVYQSDFTDSANFNGDILSNDYPITDEIEKYCQNIVHLLMPYRCNNDLMVNEKYTFCLRHAIREHKITEKQKLFLQYILDSKSNNLRFKIKADALERSAEHFHTPLQETNNLDAVNDSILHHEANDVVNQEQTFDVIQYLFADTDINDSDINITTNEVIEFDLNMLSVDSRNQCGQNLLPDVTTNNTDDTTLFGTVNETNQDHNNNNNDDDNNRSHPNVINFNKGDMMRIFRYSVNNCTLNLKDILGTDVVVTLKEANGTARSIIDWATNCKLDDTQKRAFEIITGYYILSYINTIPFLLEDDDDEDIIGILEEKERLKLLVGYSKIKSDQLICFLHGPAGSGKSTIIALLQSYSQKYHKLLKYESYNRAIVLTAMTGVAATIIGGETLHSAVHLKTNANDIDHKYVEFWTNTKLLIIDEISFANPEDIEALYSNLCMLKMKSYHPFGGINIIFCGDLRQLEPVKGDPLYKNHEHRSSLFKIHMNCYIELEGKHRFVNDPNWGRLLLRFRNGNPTESDIDLINSKVVQLPENNKKEIKMPSDIKYATYTNHDRDTINIAIFQDRLKSSQLLHHNTNNFIIIFCDNIRVKMNLGNNYMPLRRAGMNNFYKHCTESSLNSVRSGRMDPVLKLYIGCEVMITENIDVPSGLANGTRATIDKIILKQDTHYMSISVGNGIYVKGIYASQVDNIRLLHISPNVQRQTITIKSKSTTFTARIPVPKCIHLNPLRIKHQKFQCRITQFPIIVNIATTGHKLQGTGVNKLFVQKWQYDRNWPYVVMSRVKTLDGLYLRSALLRIHEKDYTLHPDYITFIDFFKQLLPISVDYNLIPNNPLNTAIAR